MPPQMNYQIRQTDGALKGNLGWLYTILWLHCDQLLRCFPSNDLLMDETGIKSTATLTKHRNQLIKMKAITLVPYEKRFMVIEGELHPHKYIYQLTGILELPDGKIIPTVHFGRPETLKAHINVLADLEFDTSLIIQAHASHDENSEFHKLKLLDFSHRSSTLKEKALSSTISSAEKSAEGAAPTTTSDAKKKEEAARAIDWQAKTDAANIHNDTPEIDWADAKKKKLDKLGIVIDADLQESIDGIDEFRTVVDWQAKILATLTDDWMLADHLETELLIPSGIIGPVQFSKHPAAIALYDLEGERKVEFRFHEDSRRRQWRLHSDYGQPAPKSDFDLLKLAISRCLGIHNGPLGYMTHMLRGTAKMGVYGKEAEHFADNPVSADELESWVDHWVKHHPDIDKPSKPETVSSLIAGYRIYVAAAGKQPEIDWSIQPEEPEPITIVDWGKDES